MLQFFRFEHLPEKEALVALPFAQMANHLCAILPQNPERTVALRKLLESRDCALRALNYEG
jgi:hypothetical protein